MGYFGSYARGDWGVGSDVDLLVLLSETGLAFERRALAFPATGLPVPADVLAYTVDEWRAAVSTPGLVRRAAREMVWVHGAPPPETLRPSPSGS